MNYTASEFVVRLDARRTFHRPLLNAQLATSQRIAWRTRQAEEE